ncbi:MAG: inositol monophosphatase family protein [Candidatus Woesearchaeota archaeon]
MTLEQDVKRAFDVSKKLVVETGMKALEIRSKHMRVAEGRCETIGQIRDISTEADWRSLKKMLKTFINMGMHKRFRIHVEEEDARFCWAQPLIGKFTSNAKYRLTIDPIDGTANYASKTPSGIRMVKKLSERVNDIEKHLVPNSWGPMIGLEENGTAYFGTIFQPSQKKLFYAMRGNGAFIEYDVGRKTELKIDKRARFKMGNIIYTNSDGLEKFLKFARSGLNVRHHGSYAYTAMRIAEGHAECIVAKEPKLHDVIPPMCILREAGGIVVDERGKDAIAGKSKYFIFAPNIIYVNALLKTLKTRGDKVLELEF